MRDSSGNKETSAGRKRMTLFADNESARAGMDEIQFVLSVWGLSVDAGRRKQFNEHRAMTQPKSKGFAVGPLLGDRTGYSLQEFGCGNFHDR